MAIPGLIAHCINEDLWARDVLDCVPGSLAVGCIAPPGFVRLSADGARQEWTVEPRQGRSSTFHSDKERINGADPFTQLDVQL